MCGIAGSILLTQSTHNPQHSLEKVIQRLSHRGPDHQQVIDLGVIQLAHSRLSIIDTTPHAHQPMLSEDRNFCLVFNGEIYNFVEIKAELESLNYQFKTHSDTEVLLKAWQQWGPQSLTKLSGMFAFGIWNNAQQTLYLARDRMGEKPLYYTTQHGLLFASELNALLAHPSVSKTINYQAINQFLSLNHILTNQCIIKNIHKLPPAHLLTYRLGKKAVVSCYWDLAQQFKKNKTTLSFKESQQHYLTLYDQTVAKQLRSDVTLGAYLSGGLDSSSIVASMLKTLQNENVHTFSIDFNQASFSEAIYSKQAATHLNVDHSLKTVDINQPSDIFQAMNSFDEPFADTSLIPCYYLAQYSKQFITVALSGDGGDELFAGYDTYIADRYYRLFKFLPHPIKKYALRLVNNHMRSSFDKISLDYKLKQFLNGLNFNFQRAHYSWREIFSETEKKQLCRKELINKFETDPFHEYCQHFKPVENCHWLDQSCYVDMKTWLADDILVKVDRSSMAHSLEVRSPFLDHNLVEFAAQLPHNWKLKSREKKYYLKTSQLQRLPRKLIYRKKSGFNAPLAHWLLNPNLCKSIHTLLFQDHMKELFCEDYLTKLWIDHQIKTKDNSLKIFGLMSLANYLKLNE